MHFLVIRLKYLTIPLALNSKILLKSFFQLVQHGLSKSEILLMSSEGGIVN